MQQFYALLKKELNGCFKSGFAYLIFFVYLFISVGTAFYFGAYLAMHDTGLYALFYAQPIILAVLLPAVTMRSWSEEYRSGTAEFLLTQPVADRMPVWAKTLAASLLFGFMSLFLLPFIFYSATWLHLDWGNIVLDYIGLWLLIGFLSALGCLISALCRHVMISYLFSVFVMGLWIALPFSGLYGAYNNFLFAEVGVADWLYFLLFAGGFIGLNILAIAFRRTVEKHRRSKFAGFTVLLGVGIALLLAALYNFLPAKADLTASRLYSPKMATQEILPLVDQPVSIDVYAARDYISGNNEYYLYFQQILRFLQKYTQMTQGMITVNSTVVEAFSEMENNLLEKGLYFEENQRGTKNYFGAVIRLNSGQEMVIRQFLLERRPYVEKDIDTAILKLLRPHLIKKIGVVLDTKQNLEPYETLFLNLENDYTVFTVQKEVYEISPQIDLLMLINPKELPPIFTYALDQFVMRGGKLMVFYDFFSARQNEIVNLAPIDFVSFLSRWNITLKEDFTDDGVLNPDFAGRQQLLQIYQAIPFAVENKELKIRPFIYAQGGLLGAILQGRLESMYLANPYLQTKLGADMQTFVPFNNDAKVAIVSDVDLLDDLNWNEPNSPDRNPYSVIYKSGNAEAVRNLIDTMVGNDIYPNLPINAQAANEKSIGQQINDMAYGAYTQALAEINQQIKQMRTTLMRRSDDNVNKMQALLQISTAGQDLAKAEKKAEMLAYRAKQDYARAIDTIMLTQIFIVPLGLALLLCLLFNLANRRRQKKIKEMFDE